jgi:hypothetical protein
MSSYCSPAVITQGGSSDRTGTYLCETQLKPSLITQQNFGRLSMIQLDGAVYAQVLYLPRREFDTFRDVAFVATMRNTVYCIDVTDSFHPSIIWQTNVGQWVDTVKYISPSYMDVPGHELGILSTPFIDQASSRMYFCSHQIIDDQVKHMFGAINIFDGSLHTGKLVQITASVPGTGAGSVNGEMPYIENRQLMRPAMTMVGNYLLVGSGSLADLHPFHGWMFAFRRETLEQVGAWCATPNTEGGGQRPHGFIAVDSFHPAM